MHLSMEFGENIFIRCGVIDILPKLNFGGGRHLGFVCGTYGTTHEGKLVVRTPCKNVVMVGSVVSCY